jgi:putative chitinase
MGSRRPGPLGAHGHVAGHASAATHAVHHGHNGQHSHGGHHAHHGQAPGPEPGESDADSFIKDKALRDYIEMRPLTGGLTASLLRQSMRHLSASNAKKYIDSLNAACKRCEITRSVRRMAAFLGHIALESMALNRVEEKLGYVTTDRVLSVYKGTFKKAEEAEPYLKDAKALANKVYGGKNGNTEPDDGWKYRGRGFIHLTFKNNYQELKNEIGVDVVADPDLLKTPKYAALSAAVFWKLRGLNELADKGMYRALSHKVNKGLQGYAQRETNRKYALNALCKAILAEMTISMGVGAFWTL